MTLRMVSLVMLAACSPGSRSDTQPDAGLVDPDAALYAGSLDDHYYLPGLALEASEPPPSFLPRLAVAPAGIVIAGQYWQAGRVPAPALWDGNAFVALPASELNRVAVAPDGRIFAAERWPGCLRCSPPNVKVLVQNHWQVLPGFFSEVVDLTATSAGLFVVDQQAVLRFDGSVWTELGRATGLLEVVEERGGTLCVAGAFTSMGGVAARNVACMTSAGWAQAGDGLDGPVHALAFAPDGRLLAGGRFSVAGGANVAVLGASTWSAVGGGVGGIDGEVRAIAVDGDAVVVGGAFDSPVVNLGRFSQGVWSGVPGTWSSSSGRAVVSDVVVGADGVYLAGSFERIGDVAVSHMARWTGAGVERLGSDAPLGIAGTVRALLRDSDGSIVVGGDFVAAGTLPRAGVARLVDAQWQPLGEIAEPVTALARADDLYAGTDRGSVLRWSGTGWLPLGTVGGSVRAMHAFHGDMFVGGNFADRVVKWNGTQLERVGTPLPGRVVALGTIHDQLCAGIFVADPPKPPLWCWDGASWKAEGLAGQEVDAIATMTDGKVAVSGSIQLGEYRSLVIFDGTSWKAAPVALQIFAMLPSGDGLFLAGSQGVQWWDGHSLDTLVVAQGYVHAIADTPGGLVIGAAGRITRDGSPDAFGLGAFRF